VKGNSRGRGKNRRTNAPVQSRRAERGARGRERSTRSAPLDGTLITSAAILVAIGIVMNYSATAALAIGEPLPPLAARHAVGVAFALLCACAAYRLPLSFWRHIALPFWAVTVASLLITLLIGVEANGARRWLGIPGLPIALQPRNSPASRRCWPCRRCSRDPWNAATREPARCPRSPHWWGYRPRC